MARPLLLDLALTHILGRKRQTIVSVMGVALGVVFFIAMAALMQGFQGYFIDTVINASPISRCATSSANRRSSPSRRPSGAAPCCCTG